MTHSFPGLASSHVISTQALLQQQPAFKWTPKMPVAGQCSHVDECCQQPPTSLQSHQWAAANVKS